MLFLEDVEHRHGERGDEEVAGVHVLPERSTIQVACWVIILMEISGGDDRVSGMVLYCPNLPLHGAQLGQYRRHGMPQDRVCQVCVCSGQQRQSA